MFIYSALRSHYCTGKAPWGLCLNMNKKEVYSYLYKQKFSFLKLCGVQLHCAKLPPCLGGQAGNPQVMDELIVVIFEVVEALGREERLWAGISLKTCRHGFDVAIVCPQPTGCGLDYRRQRITCTHTTTGESHSKITSICKHTM